ncbi:phenylalanine--tRNA ligase subunit alpha [Candidatus Woesearchaeota archaeon]|nr:phenylalanine--tRNA ligase subunit alpha [Candidatus Woesearchaeota archaeon]
MLTNIQETANSLSLLERKLLPHLKEQTTVSELVASSGLQEVEVGRALMWLGNRDIVSTQISEKELVVLFENGQLASKFGLPEFRILKSLTSGPKTISELESDTLPRPEIMACIGILKSKQAANIEKVNGDMQLSITPAGNILIQNNLYEPQHFFDKYTTFPLDFLALNEKEREIVFELSKRKLMVKVETQKTTNVTLQPLGKELIAANVDFSNVEEQLTDTMLKDGSWKEKTFRTYDVRSPVPRVAVSGRRHPAREANNIIRDIYLQMGFQEMSGPWVETCFWCMDSMWIPQDHPARDVQDTFFIGKEGDLPNPELVEKVKAVHETGGNTGSTGYQKPWDPNLAKQLILRTHSTATSFRYLNDLGNKDGKYFYVANVFRNEAVDTTHLAEFVQAEGFVIGDNLTLSDLMGFIKEFYARLGITKIRFKPTYNPYTEPSLEAHYYDEKKGKWYALINSGIFRPESLAPYGIKKTVIAWGMGASRVAALLNSKNNLRELVGPTVSFDWIANHKTPIPKLSEENNDSASRQPTAGVGTDEGGDY